MSTCSQCKQLASVWDDQLGSAVCTVCGTLTDPSQSVLVSHLDHHDNFARQYDYLPISSSSSILKTVRSHQGWNLAGQGKEARDIRNNHAMHEFIRSVSSSLAVPGVATRAITLFSQTIAAGKHRWGRKAKVIAAASVAVALRESHRSDSLHGIALLIDEPLLALSRAFTRILDLLKIPLASADPAIHFPVLCSHLSTLLNPSPSPSPLSRSLIALLKPLSLTAVTHSAQSLSTLVSRLEHPSLKLNPTPAAACAFFILALEAEARTSVPGLAELAENLGNRIGAGKGIIMQRYKVIYDIVEEWTREIPWLDKFTSKNGRSKLSKRVIVARGLKDVIQFQEDIWRKKFESESLKHPTVVLDADEHETDDGTDYPVTTPSPHKKHKVQQDLAGVSQFLLDPLSADIPTSGTVHDPHSLFSFTSYLLTADDVTFSLRNAPTRLQVLAAERGGEENIVDDELFEEDEWEAIVRSEEECKALRDVLQWDDKETDGGTTPKLTIKRKVDEGKEGKRASPPNVHLSGRINRDVYTKLLQRYEVSDSNEHLGIDVGTYTDNDLMDEQFWQCQVEKGYTLPNTSNNSTCAGSDEVMESWRPLSPDHTCAFGIGDRYDEEC